MKHFYNFFLVLLCTPLFSQDTLEFSSSGEPVEIDFSDFMGTGISNNPSNGELNSNNWSVLGMSDGDVDFGANAVTADFEGQSIGEGESSGGLYSLSNDTNALTALWIQPTSSDFTPGALVLRLQNVTGGFITSFDISYTALALNDGERSNSFNLSYATDGVNFIPVNELDFASDELPDGTLSSNPKMTTVNALGIPDSDFLFLKWEGDDISGSGSRDEFGLDDISVTPFTGEPSTLVNFASTAVEVSEGAGQIFVQATLNNPGNCQLEIGVDASSSAVSGTDFGSEVLDSYSFTNEDVISIPINIFDDAVVEGDETIVLNIESVSGDGCQLGGASQTTVTIADNDSSGADAFTIAEVTETTPTGAYLFEGQTVEITGTVVGINLRPGGLQFTMNDGTGGISLFSLVEDFGYTVNQGDIIRVEGVISVFLGLGQILPSVLEVVGGDAELPAPTPVLTLNEGTESELISLEFVQLVDPLQWVAAGSDFSVDITNGSETYEMRIDNQVDLFTSGPISGLFSVVGIGGQVDPSAPLTEGYLIQPRSSNDITSLVIIGSKVSFEEGGIEVLEGEQSEVQIPITLSESIAADCIVDIAIHPSTSATASDFTLSSNTLTIAAGQTSQSLTIEILDDEAPEELENIWLELNPQNENCQVSFPAFKKITISDNDEAQIPEASQVGSLTQNDASGIPLQTGMEVTIEGVVYGTNVRPSGLQFTVIDNTGGIGIFYSGEEDLGYTVTEGDRVLISGILGNFSGLTQINPTFIELIDQGQSLVSPSVTTELNEQSESELVSLGCVSLVDPTQWNPGGAGFNVEVSNGFVTRQMRIDADVDLFNMSAPEGNFLVTGIGGQFDQEAPFDSGYQILPRYAMDIDGDFCPNDTGIAGFGDSEILKLYPNPAREVITITSTELIDQIEIFDLLGRSQYVAELQNFGQNISLRDLAPGIYFVKVKVGAKYFQERFLKN